MVTSGSHLVELFFLPRSMALDTSRLPAHVVVFLNFFKTSHVGARGTADRHYCSSILQFLFQVLAPSGVSIMGLVIRFSSWEGNSAAAALRFHSDPPHLIFTSLGMVLLGWLMADRALTRLSRLGPLVSIPVLCLVDSGPKHHPSCQPRPGHFPHGVPWSPSKRQLAD
ncbi:hypothetical protein BJX68DRAFT_219399 [Aspergillus pseudodeflectus]|uniref:Uncharacterized protein n=1 Tax=Aspergillus pseudodeflectus TaxID=176178 RepID=A0ABR4JCG3_9EURO